MIICFDLDGTITQTDSNYEPEYWKKRKVSESALCVMNLAKKKGHKIIIHTSRLTSEARIQTIQWLEENKVPYDGIFFDKPFYDYVVDDKSVTLTELVDKV